MKAIYVVISKSVNSVTSNEETACILADDSTTVGEIMKWHLSNTYACRLEIVPLSLHAIAETPTVEE